MSGLAVKPVKDDSKLQIRQSPTEHLPRTPMRALFLANSGGGKTTLIANLLTRKELYGKAFSTFFIFSPSVHHAGTWQPAGSDACGWSVSNWAIDLLLRQSLVYAAVGGLGGASPYGAGKHGVVGLTRTAALEYAQQNIRVNAVCPGVFETPLLEKVIAERPEREKLYLDAQPIGRLGRPEELAAAVVWLCSDEASVVTGHAFPVDGGYTAA